MRFHRLVTLLALVFLFLTACSSSGDDEASGGDDSAASETTRPAGSPEPTQEPSDSEFLVAAGDCFDDPGGAGSPFDLDTGQIDLIDCAEPHDNEVYLAEEYTESESYPGDDALRAAATAACEPAFNTYVGISYEESRFFSYFLLPSPASWDANARTIVCVLYDPEAKTVGTASGSAE